MIHSRAEENSSKKEGCTPETEWESHIEEVEPLPFQADKLPVRGVDRDIAKG